MYARLIFAAALLLSALPAQARDDAPRTVLAIFAHPDDEIVVAPMLAAAAREGGEVLIVHATSGDQGAGVSGMEPGAKLAARREGEARCAADALGAAEPILLRLGDGTLGIRAHDPLSAAERLQSEVEKLVAEHRPEVIVTWGPDGGYGHADHRIVSAVVTQVV